MAVVTGGLFSMTVRGTVGKSLTYRKHKKNTVVAFFSKPTDPGTAAQRQQRDRMRLLAQIWNEMYQTSYRQAYNQYGYTTLVNRSGLNPFAQFLHFYLPHSPSSWAILNGIDSVYDGSQLGSRAYFHKYNLSLPFTVQFHIGIYPYDNSLVLTGDAEEFPQYFMSSILVPLSSPLIYPGYIWCEIISPHGYYVAPILSQIGGT